jgi:hypothetical protein
MTTTKYSALWQYVYDLGSRSACAISSNPESLLSLHEEHIKNLNSCWHNYKDRVNELKVEPIECYFYNTETKELEPYCDNHNADDHNFYAFNTISDFGLNFYENVNIKITDSGGNELDSNDYDLDKGEILVYLSKTVHQEWLKCTEMCINIELIKYYKYYTYNTETKELEPYCGNNDDQDHNYYLFNTVSLKFGLNASDIDYDLDKDEILVYLSKTIHEKLIKCEEVYKFNKHFYTEWPSHLPVIPDVYYDEGIMNA